MFVIRVVIWHGSFCLVELLQRNIFLEMFSYSVVLETPASRRRRGFASWIADKGFSYFAAK